jgi:hypothetical protein
MAKDEAAEARRRHVDEEEQARVELTPKNLHDILNGVEELVSDGMECSMEEEAGSWEEEHFPLKKRPVSSKTSSRHPHATTITPSVGAFATPPTEMASGKSTPFLDAFVSFPLHHS